MKTILRVFHSVLIMSILIALCPAVQATDEDDVRGRLVAYFEALKSGNVKELALMITDPLLASKRMLLEQNPAYPAYLQKYYKDATMRVIQIRAGETDMQTATAEILFPNDDRPLRTEFFLKRTENGWKIAHEGIAQ